jgi:antitoxin component of RelBE/YafQ-DinJ toxin-antitoxin module
MNRERKHDWVRARVTTEHLTRMAELEKATGLTQSEVMRMLIMNARLEPRPMPVSILEARGEA